jgi:tyrosine-protein kinase Etk/Wzc
MESKISMTEVIKTIYRSRRLIATIVIVACVVTAALSLLLPNYYTSNTIFYSASTDLAKPEFLFGGGDKEYSFYGTGVDNDRLFTVAGSRDMLGFLIDSFKLKERYNFKGNDPKMMEKLYQKTKSHYKIIKTKYDAIELSFEDKDPEFAALVTRAAREHLDHLLVGQIKSKQRAQLENMQRSIDEKSASLEEISESLKAARSRYRILNASAQSEMLATLITETESKIKRETARLGALQGTKVKRDTIDFIAANLKGLEEELNSLLNPAEGSIGGLNDFTEGRQIVENLEGRFYTARLNITYDKERMKQIKAAYDAEISFLHLVEDASVPLVKSRPKRSIYVITIFFVSLFLSVLGVLLQASFQNFEWNALIDESKPA